MHIGSPAKPIVKVGDEVRRGELIAEATGFVSSPVFASIPGKVTAISDVDHPLGKKSPAIEITFHGQDEEENSYYMPDLGEWQKLSKEDLLKRVQEAGVVGRGGASFPTHVKLTPPPDKKIDTLIINGAECEPYLTADHRLMLERAEEFLTGTAIVMRILEVSKAYVGIEKNKPDAIRVVQKKIKELNMAGIKVIPLETKYPQGGEKQLIYAITKRVVPSGGLPMDAGAVVQNVGTAHSVYKAVVRGKSLCYRVVTVTGCCVKKPGNYIIPVGVPIREVLEYADTDMASVKKVLLGGPMMGIALASLEAPIIKSTSGILVLSKTTPSIQEHNCINCGACVEACPIHLIPSHLSKYVRKNRFDDAENHNVLDCIECGSCAYSCPSKINLVHDIRLGKNRVIAKRKKEQ